jgi:hypothetical protein
VPGLPVVNGAQTLCTFGLSASSLIVTPEKQTLTENMPAATIMDNKPFVNVLPFGLCTSLMNPVTASQTAAALGVLTPGPCTPVIPAPWVPGSPTVLVRNQPALTQQSKCICAYGGVITILNPVVTKTIVP